jgi:RimJ/RimL family protein N-acetyltransferase
VVEFSDEESKKQTVPPPRKAIGFCGGHKLPEIGYVFDSLYWGTGYATEAMKAFLECYWKTFPDGHPAIAEKVRDFVVAIVQPENQASVNVLMRCGFEFWKTVEEKDMKSDGKTLMKLNLYLSWRPGVEKVEPEWKL